MRKGLFALVVSVALLTLPAAELFGSASSTPRQERAVLQLVQEGRTAILNDRPARVCALMTRRARRNSLVLADLDRSFSGQKRPKPTTCLQAIGYQIDDARASGELRTFRTNPAVRKVRIVQVQGNRAHLRQGSDGEIYLLKRKAGWRADYANFAPFDGSSGR